MFRRRVALIAGALLVVCGLAAAPKDRSGDAKAIEGFWVGSWGGGARDGVVFQPAVAELFIRGDQVEIYGFPDTVHLVGTVRIDVKSKRLEIVPVAEAGEPAPKAIAFSYQVRPEQITLTDGGKRSITFARHTLAEDPPANTQFDVVAAKEIDEAGDLLVTEFNAVRIGRAGVSSFQPVPRSLHTKQATVLVVGDDGVKEVSLDEARQLLGDSSPVAVTYRRDNRQPAESIYHLLKEVVSPAPDSAAARRTIARVLRPGTLVFVLSAQENAPQP